MIISMKILTGLIFVFLLGAMFVGLFATSQNMHAASGMSDCPFMAHGETLCSMTFSDHIAAWKSTFLALAPTFLLLLAIHGVVTLVLSTAPHLRVLRHLIVSDFAQRFRERVYTYFYRPLQEFFSSGVLHPKLF